jgi:hypothetical protein
MRYLEQSEISAYLNSKKQVEQFLGEFYFENFKCYRYVTFDKTTEGFIALLFEKFDDSNEGLTSIYDYSSVEPDEMYGKEFGPYNSLEEVLEKVHLEYEINSDKFLLAGNLDEEIGTEPNKT